MQRPEDDGTSGQKKSRLAKESKKVSQPRTKHRKTADGSKDDQPVEDDKEAKLRKLREDRMKRERKEAEKAGKLLSNPAASVRSTVDERKIEYHQQFNPHLVRRH